MQEVISRVLKRISTALSIVIGTILLFSIYAWVQVNVMHEDYATIFGYSVFNVVTGSMSGTIEIDDYVIVKHTKDIKLNDIVTFEYDNVLITHRVREIKGEQIVTRGDVNNSDDYAITQQNIIGKVVKILPKAGIWKNVLTKPEVLGCIFVTLIAFAFFFSFEEKKYIEVRIHGNMDLLRKPKRKKTVKAKFSTTLFGNKENIAKSVVEKKEVPSKPIIKKENKEVKKEETKSISNKEAKTKLAAKLDRISKK